MNLSTVAKKRDSTKQIEQMVGQDRYETRYPGWMANTAAKLPQLFTAGKKRDANPLTCTQFENTAREGTDRDQRGTDRVARRFQVPVQRRAVCERNGARIASCDKKYLDGYFRNVYCDLLKR